MKTLKKLSLHLLFAPLFLAGCGQTELEKCYQQAEENSKKYVNASEVLEKAAKKNCDEKYGSQKNTTTSNNFDKKNDSQKETIAKKPNYVPQKNNIDARKQAREIYKTLTPEMKELYDNIKNNSTLSNSFKWVFIQTNGYIPSTFTDDNLDDQLAIYIRRQQDDTDLNEEMINRGISSILSNVAEDNISNYDIAYTISYFAIAKTKGYTEIETKSLDVLEKMSKTNPAFPELANFVALYK